MVLHSWIVEVEGEPIEVSIGSTDARMVIRIAGPSVEEFAYLTIHPKAWGALAGVIVDMYRAPAAPAPAAEESETPLAAE